MRVSGVPVDFNARNAWGSEEDRGRRSAARAPRSPSPWDFHSTQSFSSRVASEVFLERPAEGTPHKGKVLLAVQTHSDDIPLMAAGTVAKLVKEGYAGLTPHTVQEKYCYARRPEVNRVVDVSGVIDQLIDANRANRAKGPAGNHGSRLRAELAKRGQKLALLGDNDVTADRNYIREFVLTRHRTLGKKHGVPHAEAFHYFGGGPRRSAVEEFVKKNAVPIK